MTRKTLNSDQRSILERTDHDDETGLSLFHYKQGVIYEGDLKECGRIRGAVVNNDNEIVYEFFPKHIEWIAGLGSQGGEDDIGCLEDYNVFTAIEAALIRVFHYNGKWFLSTNRRLDAFQSRWSSKYSFGEMFEYTLRHMFPNQTHCVLQYFFSSLDPLVQYVFLLRLNSDNRIVCRVHNIDLQDRLVFVGVFREDQPVIEHVQHLYLDHPVLSRFGRQKIVSPDSLGLSDSTYPKTFEAWETYVINHIDPMESPGLILIHKTINRQIKIIHPRYADLVKLRGNQPNLVLRYLELRNMSTHDDLQNYIKLYERNTRIFHQTEQMLMEIARRINFWYTERYVHNRFVSVPFPEYSIMKKCHQWYMEDPQNRRVYIRVVTDFLNKESPLSLYRMINRVRQENHRPITGFRSQPVRKRIISRRPMTTDIVEAPPSSPISNPPLDIVDDASGTITATSTDDNNNYNDREGHPDHATEIDPVSQKIEDVACRT